MKSIMILVSKGPTTCSIVIQGEIIGNTTIGNDLGHPWKGCAFQAYFGDMHMHIP